MKHSFSAWLLYSLGLLSIFLSGCSPLTMAIVVSPFAGIRDTVSTTNDKRKWEEQWKERLQDKTDIDAATNCVFAQQVLLNTEELEQSYEKEPRNKFWLPYKAQCIQTVLEAWGDAPKNHEETVAVISAYMVLARDAQTQGDETEAKQLRLKALSYLGQDAFVLRRDNIDDDRYNDMRVEYTYQHNGTGFIYNRELIYNLLSHVKVLDQESQVCTYPRELEPIFSTQKFKGTNFLRSACSHDVPLFEMRKWKIIWDDEKYIKYKKATSGDPCEDIKRFKPIGQGVLVLSSHPDGKGLIYTGEPYNVYQDGCLVKQTVTNDKGELIFDYADESFYILEFFFRQNILTERPAVLRPIKK